MLAAAGAMVWLAQLGLHTGYAAGVVGPLIVAANLASARPIGRQAVAGLALAHGYDTAFWWLAGIFAGGAAVCGVLLRNGPLTADRTPSPAAGNPGQGEIAGIR